MHENRVVSDNQNPRFHIFSIPFFLGVDAEPKEDRITNGLTLILPLEFAHSQQIFSPRTTNIRFFISNSTTRTTLVALYALDTRWS